jgi:hypothetical protein
MVALSPLGVSEHEAKAKLKKKRALKKVVDFM